MMIEFTDSERSDLCKLKNIWKQAFRDEDAFIDLFFAKGYTPECSRIARYNGEIAGMLYWFDCSLEEKKFAYLYGVATDGTMEGRGIATKLLQNTQTVLKDRGYAGAVLVPGSGSLVDFYQKRGYEFISSVCENHTVASGMTPMTAIDADTYCKIRMKFITVPSIGQLGRNAEFLSGMGTCYQGEDFCMVYSEEMGRCVEFLGNLSKLPGIAGTLHVSDLGYRSPGRSKSFAMGFRWDGEDWPKDLYFGLAFD